MKTRNQIIQRLLQAGIPQTSIDARFAELDDTAFEKEFLGVEFAVILKQFTDDVIAEASAETDEEESSGDAVAVTREDVRNIVTEVVTQLLGNIQVELPESDSDVSAIVREQGTVIGTLTNAVQTLAANVDAMRSLFTPPANQDAPRAAQLRLKAVQKHAKNVQKAENGKEEESEAANGSIFDIAREDKNHVVRDGNGNVYNSVSQMLFPNN